MRTAIICGALMALVVTTANGAPTQYLCVAESVGGLRYDAKTQSWKSQDFMADGKYVLRRINDDDRKKYGILLKYAGTQGAPESDADWAFFTFEESPRPLATCEESGGSEFVCQRVVGAPLSDIDINFHRYEMVYRGGYIGQGLMEQLRRERPDEYKRQLSLGYPTGPEDLIIEIGMCSPF